MGFTRGASLLNGANFLNCERKLDEYRNATSNITLLYYGDDAANPPVTGVEDWLLSMELDNADAFKIYLINDDLIWMLGNMYSLANSCYYGAFEVLGGLADYVYWAKNPEVLQSNIINDAGFIYTGVRDLTLFFIRSERSLIRTNYELGRAFGQLYYFVLISGFYATFIETVSPVQIDTSTGTIVFIDQ